MLVFERAQLQAFAEAAFVSRMSEVLCALSPQDGVCSSEAVAQGIREQLAQARKHGFTAERDCARWVLCAWCLGGEFERKILSMSDLLRRSDVGPAYKALALELMLRAIFTALAGQSRSVL